MGSFLSLVAFLPGVRAHEPHGEGETQDVVEFPLPRSPSSSSSSSLASSSSPMAAPPAVSFLSSADSISTVCQEAEDADGWPFQFISSRGNEYFCEVDEEYLTDRFNLTGLQSEVQYYQYALDLVTDVFDLDCEDDMRETIEKSARHLYGLVHARYIVTTRGLAKMVRSPNILPRPLTLQTPD